MTDYKAIKGKTILNLASDLDNAEGEGEIWFNTTSSAVKTIVKVAGAWATGGAGNTARDSPAGDGIQTAAFAAGGVTTVNTVLNEHYDGSSWTEVADFNTARSEIFGLGTTAAGLVAGGYISANQTLNEEWNGTSWTESGDLNTARRGGASAGTQTAGLIAVGTDGPGGGEHVVICETYDGSSWTEVGDAGTARYLSKEVVHRQPL